MGPKSCGPGPGPGSLQLLGPMCSIWAPWVHGPYQILKETYQILKESYPILKETHQILKENYQIPSPYGIRAPWGHIRPYGALASSAAAPGKLIFAKIVDSVKYLVIS